jgi:hypothetical protein
MVAYISKRVMLDGVDNTSARKAKALSTVTHFNITHFTCHREATKVSQRIIDFTAHKIPRAGRYDGHSHMFSDNGTTGKSHAAWPRGGYGGMGGRNVA